MTKDQKDTPLRSWKERFAEAQEAERLDVLTKRYGKLASEAAAIPEDARAQMTLLLPVREQHIAKRVAATKGVSVQELLRVYIADGNRRELAVATPRKRKTA